MNQMISVFKQSPNYQHRITFIEFYIQGAQYFSRPFYKKYNLISVLDLSYDKVSNVRIKFARSFKVIR